MNALRRGGSVALLLASSAACGLPMGGLGLACGGAAFDAAQLDPLEGSVEGSNNDDGGRDAGAAADVVEAAADAGADVAADVPAEAEPLEAAPDDVAAVDVLADVVDAAHDAAAEAEAAPPPGPCCSYAGACTGTEPCSTMGVDCLGGSGSQCVVYQGGGPACGQGFVVDCP